MTKHLSLTIIFSLAVFCKLSAQISFNLLAEGFDSHVELVWETPPNSNPNSYKIFRSSDGTVFSEIRSTSNTTALDFTGRPAISPDTYYYYVSALNGINVEIAISDTAQVTVAEKTDGELMDMVQRYTFRYFWEFAHPVSGMARERNTSGDIVTSGGSGFGIMAILVGIERGFINRQEGLNRLLQIVSFLQFADKFHGVFPHWMNGANGNVVPFSQYDDGGDLVETAFLMQGLLTARQYFNQNDPLEDALRQAVTGLWEDVEWDFYRKNNSGVLYWHWSPNYAWQINLPIRGYNEALIIYLLAIASPTHPVPASLWNTGWTSGNYASGLNWYGHQLSVGPSYGGPLFFAHYSYLGFDPRDKRDAYANYFTQNANHTLINRAYCVANPLNHDGYSNECWGLTASDDPFGYKAHAPGGSNDNGTITPTAALSSMPYTPTESMAALKHLYREHGERLWGEMGFYDAFNIEQDWYADSYLAIDQGPIICMIENHRTALLWDMFMANPEIQPALDAIGFVEDITAVDEPLMGVEWDVFPNPASDLLNVRFHIEKQQNCSMDVLDVHGRQVLGVFENKEIKLGEVDVQVRLEGFVSGLYLLRLQNGKGVSVRRFLKN